MSVKQSHPLDPIGRRSRRFRSMRRLALLPAVALLGFAPALLAGTGDDSGKGRAAGDGRGLTSFGNRGLTSFGSRFDGGFSRRALTSFSDTPLAPMGGLVRSGALSTRRVRLGTSSNITTTGGGGFVTTTAGFSQATLRVDAGSAFGDGSDGALLMPAVELPAVVFDHRPAAEQIDATLDAAIRAADERGDFDLARSLDPDRR